MTSLFKPIKQIIEFYYMSHGLTFKIFIIILAKFLPTLGYDLKIDCGKFQGNRLIIDGEIDKKQALQNYQNECGSG